MGSEATSAGAWHVEQNGERKGPLATEVVERMVGEKVLDRDSLCWQPGMQNWQPLNATPLARLFADEPPPLHPSTAPSEIVWALAFAPVIGLLLEETVAHLTATPVQKAYAVAWDAHINELWWITLVLNVALSLLDERRLKKRGFNTKKMGQAWLVPVYLYRRAKTLGDKPVHFVVWMVGFFAVLFF